MNRLDTSSPDHLLVLARAGDVQALGELLEQYRNYLTLLAGLELGRRLHGKLDEADVVQDVFLEAARHFDGFRGVTEREFLFWLRRIMATVLANIVRRYHGTKRRDVNLERALADGLDGSSCALDGGLIAARSSPSQYAARREQAVLLADALQRLPSSYRDAIILHHLEGLTFTEVAARLERSLDSVKKLWVRGLEMLRGELRSQS